MKDFVDKALPSANSIAADNLLRLWALTKQQRHRNMAEELFSGCMAPVQNHPEASHSLLMALDRYHNSPKQVAIVYPASDRTGARKLLDAVRSTYSPNVVVGMAAEEIESPLPLLKDKFCQGQKATAYVCGNTECSTPTTDPKALLELIRSPEILALPSAGMAMGSPKSPWT